MRRVVLVAIMGLVPASQAFAGSAVAVPEINPVSVSAGLALLTGGVLLARARWRK